MNPPCGDWRRFYRRLAKAELNVVSGLPQLILRSYRPFSSVSGVTVRLVETSLIVTQLMVLSAIENFASDERLRQYWGVHAASVLVHSLEHAQEHIEVWYCNFSFNPFFFSGC